jgi:hypothetical protein
MPTSTPITLTARNAKTLKCPAPFNSSATYSGVFERGHAGRPQSLKADPKRQKAPDQGPSGQPTHVLLLRQDDAVLLRR